MAFASGQGLARRSRWSLVLFYCVTAIILLPFLWIAFLSFKSNAQILGTLST
jgi:ABC-type glycerol-3-phosphate transport system permease component